MTQARGRFRARSHTHIELLRTLLRLEVSQQATPSMARLGELLGRTANTVARVLHTLEHLGLATQRGAAIRLTDRGRAQAQDYEWRERTIREFFESVLNMPSTELQMDPSRLALVLSDKVVQRMGLWLADRSAFREPQT